MCIYKQIYEECSSRIAVSSPVFYWHFMEWQLSAMAEGAAEYPIDYAVKQDIGFVRGPKYIVVENQPVNTNK